MPEPYIKQQLPKSLLEMKEIGYLFRFFKFLKDDKGRPILEGLDPILNSQIILELDELYSRTGDIDEIIMFRKNLEEFCTSREQIFLFAANFASKLMIWLGEKFQILDNTKKKAVGVFELRRTIFRMFEDSYKILMRTFKNEPSKKYLIEEFYNVISFMLFNIFGNESTFSKKSEFNPNEFVNTYSDLHARSIQAWHNASDNMKNEAPLFSQVLDTYNQQVQKFLFHDQEIIYPNLRQMIPDYIYGLVKDVDGGSRSGAINSLTTAELEISEGYEGDDLNFSPFSIESTNEGNYQVDVYPSHLLKDFLTKEKRMELLFFIVIRKGANPNMQTIQDRLKNGKLLELGDGALCLGFDSMGEGLKGIKIPLFIVVLPSFMHESDEMIRLFNFYVLNTVVEKIQAKHIENEKLLEEGALVNEMPTVMENTLVTGTSNTNKDLPPKKEEEREKDYNVFRIPFSQVPNLKKDELLARLRRQNLLVRLPSSGSHFQVEGMVDGHMKTFIIPIHKGTDIVKIYIRRILEIFKIEVTDFV